MLKGLAPYEFICKAWTNEQDRFKIDPTTAHCGTKHATNDFCKRLTVSIISNHSPAKPKAFD
jgi:hypothetical protein